MNLIVLVFCLIGVMADLADTEIGEFGPRGSVKEAKVAVPQDIKALVQKTALHNESLFSVDKVLVDGFNGDLSAEIIGTEPAGGEYYLSSLCAGVPLAGRKTNWSSIRTARCIAISVAKL